MRVKVEVGYATEIKWPEDTHQNKPLRDKIMSFQKPSSF